MPAPLTLLLSIMQTHTHTHTHTHTQASQLRTDLGDKSYPEYTRSALAAVPFVITLWPPLLMGMNAIAKLRERDLEAGREEGRHG